MKLSFPKLFLVLLACAISPTAQQPANNAADDAAIRAVVSRYFETWASEDLDGHMALWTGLEQDRQTRREAMQRRFAEADFSFSPLTILRVKQQGGTASLYAKTERRTVTPATPTLAVTPVLIAFSLVKEEVWRIMREQPLGTALMFEFLGASEAELPSLLETAQALASPDLAQLLASQSDRQFASGQYKTALKTLQLVLAIAETLNDKKTQADVWHNTGTGYFFLRDYQQALAAHQKALVLERQLGRKAETAKVFASLGLTHLLLQQPRVALAEYQQALALYETLNERGEVSQTLEAIGNVHYDQGDYVKALAQYRKSLDYLTSTTTATYANRLVKIARVAYELGDDALALEHYRRALESFDQAGNRSSRGFVLHSIANIYYNQGDLTQALQHYQLSQQAEERAGSPNGSASALQGIGLVHVLNGDYALALPAYERNLSIAKLLRDKGQEAFAVQKVAGTCFALGDYARALQLYEEALKLREDLGDRREVASALLDLGITHQALGNYAAALRLDEKSRAAYATLNLPAGVANALLNAAIVHYVQNNFTQALAVADEAATFAKLAEEDELLWRARYRAGKCQQQLQQLPLARQALSEAITLIEKQRPAPGSTPASRSNENKSGPYLAMVDVLLALNQGAEAFQFAERAKQRGLLTMLRGGRGWITNAMTKAEQEREGQLVNDLALLNAQLARENEKQQPNTVRVQALTKQWQQTRLAYDAFLQRLYRLHPQLKTLRGEGPAVTALQAGQLVMDERRALLAYSETEDRIVLFLFSKEHAAKTPALKIFALGSNRGELYQRLTQLQTALVARNAAADAQLRELYDELLEPARAQLEGKTQLIIAPDGLLWNLPFAALQPRAAHYLIEDFALTYTPSATAWQAMSQAGGATIAVRTRTGARVAAKPNAPPETLLTFANPTLSDEMLTRLKARLQHEAFAVNAETENEAAAISQAFAAAQQQRFSGAEATAQRAKTAASQARWLHFAAPAVLDEMNPLQSGVALAVAANETNEDGMLTWREALQLKLPARLVSFTAAETAPARLGNGRAQVATSWAFFIAGCSNLLLNQWPVAGSGTTALMQEFYRQARLQPFPSRAEAWQQAVLALLQTAEYRHPYYWAGFKLFGVN
ncbi:MAG: CHAT domain-containing protein [Acidobacteria bacterium]|nr:CHAT domain-containing protein [Acidobacteriota bacterium]MBI3427870.1 CHAT domain-containing protein [Acidobacteriota bacterium]